MKTKLKISFSLGLFFIIFTFSPVFLLEAGGKEKEFLLLHTNNVTGHLFPCPT